MKKKIILLLLVFTLIMTSCQKIDYDGLTLDFKELLNAEDYLTANELYDSADEELKAHYQQVLDEYSATLIEGALSDMPFDEAKEALNKFLIFEYTKPEVQKALDNVIEDEKTAIQLNSDYTEGIDLIAVRDFDGAYQKLSAVYDVDSSYMDVESILAELKNRNEMWEDAAENNLTGRSLYANALAYKDEYVYFPTDINDVHSIVKYNFNSGETDVFPLIEFPGHFRICGINIVGDYIYFIAGEELGKGFMIESPYNIYEMKIDGTGLAVVKSGDYFDLLSYGDTFYALSYTKGLVKLDKNFENDEILSDKNIIEMQLTDSGIYFTEKLENSHDAIHVLYHYKDGETTEVMRKTLLHAYVFDEYTIFYNDMWNNYDEEIYRADENFENELRLGMIKEDRNGDMHGFIGSFDGKVMFNAASPECYRGMRHKLYTEIDMQTRLMNVFHSIMGVPEYEVINILYEESMMFVKDRDGVYSFAADPGSNPYDKAISSLEFDEELLAENMTVMSQNRPTSEDYFSDEEVVKEMPDFWYYSSPNLSVRIEAVYDEAVETMLYITNIRTKDHTGFEIGYSNLQAPGVYGSEQADDIAIINKAVFATNGDFAMTGANPWIAKVIRDGKVFDGMQQVNYEYSAEDVHDVVNENEDILAMYPDGTMAAYTKEDGITYGELLDAGVKDILSFGPILLRDGKRTDACLVYNYFLARTNPRCAWGMVEPGHYVNIVAEGRGIWVNRGITYYDLSGYFQRLGCSVAYNLDGGLSSSVVFMGRFINSHKVDDNYYVHRPLPEIVYFGTSDLVPADLENYYTH